MRIVTSLIFAVCLTLGGYACDKKVGDASAPAAKTDEAKPEAKPEAKTEAKPEAAELEAEPEEAKTEAKTEAKPEAAELEAEPEAEPEPEAKPEAPAAEAPAEMAAFMGMMKGTSDDVEAALKQHGAEELDTKDMDLYDLKDPKVVATVSKDGRTCTTLEAAAGMTTRTYDLCWKDGKIVEVVDKGMR